MSPGGARPAGARAGAAPGAGACPFARLAAALPAELHAAFRPTPGDDAVLPRPAGPAGRAQAAGECGSGASPQVHERLTTNISVPLSLSLAAAAAPAAAAVRPPGPAGGPFGPAALRTVAALAREGVPQTTLRLAEEYGPAVAFANPARSIGLDAAGWTFLTDPDDVQHVATTAAANYRERFLPDGYTFATDGKGLLASGGEYNARHRRLCHSRGETQQ